jgi:hypothetical protein
MQRSSSASRKCGYTTSKGSPCKNPSGSCQYHCKRDISKRVSSKSRSTAKKASVKRETIRRSSPPRIEPGSYVALLNDLPEPVLYRTLFNLQREELNQICKSASKLRLKGVPTKIEKICRTKRFQEEYVQKNPLQIWSLLDATMSEIGNYYVRDQYRTINIVGSTIDYTYGDGHGISLTYTGSPPKSIIGSPGKGKWRVDILSEGGDTEEAKKVFIRRTGITKLFSRDQIEINRAAKLFVRQLHAEIVYLYMKGKFVLDKMTGPHDQRMRVARINLLFKNFPK